MNQQHLAARGDHSGLWDWNLATDRVHFSPRWIAMVGSDEHQVGNTPDAWMERVHPDDIGEVRRQIDEHLAGGAREFDLPHRLLHRDGTYRWTSCHGVVVRNESGRAVRVMGCHSDVTADKVADALTGLPNRLLFIDHLARSIERTTRNPAHQFAVLVVDLGRLEPHQDEASTRTPDPLLTAAARRLETSLRTRDGSASLSRDHLVARLRGDEFAILLDGLAEIGDARVVADRVLGEIQSSFMVGGDEVFLSASIGIAVSATGYTQAEAVMRDADTALHRATLLGRARCEAFDTAILRSAQTELQLGTDFVEALARGEFVLVYQPVVSLATNRVAGFEALVRWQHSSRGRISPADFIPIAEKSGFIVPLGLWTLREACRQLTVWRQRLPDAGSAWVSVNLSSPQFTHPSLVDDVAEALREAGLPAHCLVVELTEGVAMENPAAVKGLLMQLRVMGVKVALDDFGTGQSSLAYLHQFPADKLKLDRSFIRDMETRNDIREIVGTVTTLAHQLGLEVIAEGVETGGQLALVRSLGCEHVQGYFFSKPVDRERAAELLQTGFPHSPGNGCVAAPAPDAAPGVRRAKDGSAVARPRTSKVLYVSGAAAITLALAGLVTRFAGQPPPPGGHSSPPALEIAAPVPPALEIAAPAPTAAAAPPPEPVTVVVTKPRGPERSNLPPATPPVAAPAAPASPPAPAVAPVDYSLPVVHKHALRGCEGRLTVSGSSVAFVPDKAGDRADDAFSFEYGQFVHALSEDELTIKSNTRTYRFKAADGSNKDENRARLKEISDRMSRLRPAPPAK